MQSKRHPQKPPAIDEIFDTDNTDRRITRRVDGGTTVWDIDRTAFVYYAANSAAGNEEVLSFIVELISNEGNELEPDNNRSPNCCADSYITHEQLCSPEGMT